MELIKQTMGFILLVIAVKLIAALPQNRRMAVLYFAVALSFAVWMWGSWVNFNTKPARKWLIRTIAILLAVTAGWFLLKPPAPSLIDWQKYNAESIENALAEQRPVLMKFTADWCLSCQVVEKTVYSRADIAKLIEQKNVLAIKADTTANDYPATVALKNIYKESAGVPISMLFTPGNDKEPLRWRKLTFADDLKKALEQLPSKK